MDSDHEQDNFIEDQDIEQKVVPTISPDIEQKINNLIGNKYTKIEKVDDEYHIYGTRSKPFGRGVTNIAYVYKKCLYPKCWKYAIYQLDNIGNIHGECPHCGPQSGISRTIDRIMGPL